MCVKVSTCGSEGVVCRSGKCEGVVCRSGVCLEVKEWVAMRKVWHADVY